MSEIINLEIKADQSGADEALKQVNKSLKEGTEAAEALSHVLDGDVAGAFKSLGELSKTLGIDLGLAFSPAEIIGFVELLIKAADKLKEVSESMGGWDQSAQAMYDDLLKNNTELVKFNQNLEIEKLRLNEIGKGGTDKVKQEIDNNAESVKIWSKQLEDAQARLNGLTGTHDEVRVVPEGDAEYIEQVANKASAVGEQLKHWDENIKATQQDITQLTEKIKKATQVTGPGLGKQLGVDEVQEAISTGEQVLAAKKSLAEAERQLAVDTAHSLLEQHKITVAQSEDVELTAFAKERDATVAYLRARESLLLSDSTKTAAEKKAIEETTRLQILTAEKKYQDEIVKAAGNAAAKTMQALKQTAEMEKLFFETSRDLQKKSVTEQQAADKEAIESIDRKNKAFLKGIADTAAASEEFLKGEIKNAQDDEKIQEQLIEQRYQKGQINQQQEIALVAKAKQAEVAAELAYEREILSLWHKDEKEKEAILARISNLTKQSELIETKAVTDSLKAQEQQYKQVFSQIGNAFTTNVLSMLEGTETITQGFQKMYQSLLSSLADYIAQKAEKKAEEWAIDKLFHTKSVIAETGAATGKAMTASFASVMSALPFPANVATAPAVAAAAGAQATGFGLAGLAAMFELGGIVPQDGLAYLHKDEKIIPASKSGTGAGLDGIGGITVVVNHSVSAVDAASFQGHIRRHSNMIANEVTRALKRKGAR